MEITIDKTTVSDPEALAVIFQNVLNFECIVDQDKEHFWVVGLSSRNAIQYAELVSLGILDTSLVNPRETFRFAIMKAVASIILCHNHPSGDPEPSDDDLKITRKLVESGKILGIKVIDHIIICNKNPGYYSLREKGIIF
jgi:DNA repair protein RadC